MFSIGFFSFSCCKVYSCCEYEISHKCANSRHFFEEFKYDEATNQCGETFMCDIWLFLQKILLSVLLLLLILLYYYNFIIKTKEGRGHGNNKNQSYSSLLKLYTWYNINQTFFDLFLKFANTNLLGNTSRFSKVQI